ncbi:MAG: alpha/beta fold hydrolase [Acinetobacter towneri]|nr:alpha/beta fold hydrolase [Acinetobacter towneri]
MNQLQRKFNPHRKKLKNLSTRLFKSRDLILSQSTAYEIVARYKHAQIRYYASPNKQYKEPLVFVAPLAITMSIYDLYPYRSLVKHFQHSGFDVYLIDWGQLTYQHRHLNFMAFIDDALPHCIQHILQHAQTAQISLHGWSMAGVFAMLYTAKHRPEHVKNLMILGSPVDSYASGRVGKLFQITNRLISKYPKLQHAFYSGNIPKHFIHTPGLINAIGFKILDPKAWLESNKQMLSNLHDLQTLHENATLANFLNNMIDYPGGINQDMVLNVWLQNPLKQGHIQLKQHNIDLRNIDCPLLVGAGDSDQIVTAEAAQPLCELTSSTDVTFTLIPGGHLGLMSSQKSANEFWPKLTTWLEQRSSKIA